MGLGTRDYYFSALAAKELATTGREGLQDQLRSAGAAIVTGLAGPADAESVLSEHGELLPQYGGAIRHEVKARPGYDHLQYTYSRNGIAPHTEAPGMAAPPRYIALYCHRQARCGGGQTMLGDGLEFVASLGSELRERAEAQPIRFDLVPGAGSDAIASPVYTAARNGSPPLVRYSYSVLRDNSFSAPKHDDELDLDHLPPFNAELCRRGVSFIREDGIAALPGDGELLIFDNWRMLHARAGYTDPERHLTRYWVGGGGPSSSRGSTGPTSSE